jgi:hypothetical protein
MSCRLEIAKGAQPCDADTLAPEVVTSGPAHDAGVTLRDQRVLVVEDEALWPWSWPAR